MKILEVIPSLNFGGAERLVMDLSISLSKKADVKVLTLYDSKDEFFTKEIVKNKIDYINLNKSIGFDVKCFIKTFKLIRRMELDIIHCHLDALKYIFLPAILFKKPVVYTIHNLADKDATGYIKKLYGILFKYFNITPVAICDEVKKSAIEYYGDFLIGMDRIYNGINLTEINNAKINQQISNDEYLNFLCVATFKEQKNHYYLIDLFNEISIKYTNAKLYLAGDGKLKKDIIEYVKQNKLEENIIFLGDRDDIYTLMKSCDIFIICSKFEGFSIAILEAMASKMKIIVSDVGGNKEQIIDNQTGMIFNLEDGFKVINNIDKLISNKNIGENAAKMVKDKFDINVIAEEYIKLFKRKLKNEKNI